MSRVLILGAAGMLGHKLCQLLPTFGHEVLGTIRSPKASLERFDGVYDQTRLIEHVDATDDDALARVVSEVTPDAIVNCIGVIKQLKEAHNALLSVRLNAYLPHRLAALAAEQGCRLVHISTDCVFSGERGGYTEADLSDARDLYGKSKHLGETLEDEPAAVTLRTSIIGRELRRPTHGLLEWFLAQRGGKCGGFAGAIYTGLTTIEAAGVIDLVIRQPDLRGLYHVATSPINKYDLLHLIADVLGLDVTIERDEKFQCDRSLVMDRFTRETGYQAPSWQALVAGLRADSTPYDDWFPAE
jgi:dTDP-4-dehydrorhamnose reductase